MDGDAVIGGVVAYFSCRVYLPKLYLLIPMADPTSARPWYRTDTAVLVSLALAQIVVHLPFLQEYGYFRDELYYIACSNHLAWGYVDQPPLSIGILAIVRLVLGDSLFAIRIVPVLAGSVTVVLTGLIAKEMGGRRSAQVLAALAALTAPVILGNAARFFSMNAFDILSWAAAMYIAVLLAAGHSGKLWLAFGAVAGLGMQNKYSIAFLMLGLGVGMILTPLRKQLVSRWFWSGAALGALIILPNLLWEVRNGFPTAEFIHNAAYLKNSPTTPLQFLVGQFNDVGFGNAIVWIAGLVFLLVTPRGKPFRVFGFAYIAIFVLMASQNSKPYYLSPVYPVLFAAGGCMIEALASKARLSWIRPAAFGLVVILAIPALPFTLPVLPVDSFISYQNALGVEVPRDERGPVALTPQYYADMFGWQEMVDTVARIYRSLTPDDQAQCLIYVRNYGEAGAIDFFGQRLGLPQAACAHNSCWFWKPGQWNGQVGIFFGRSNDTADCFNDLRRFFDSVELAGTTRCVYAMPYENGRPIFLCRRAHFTLDWLWERDRYFI